eukprot:COSAG01_NODE_3597_length_5894_cov_1.898188_7_plen_343_part_00
MHGGRRRGARRRRPCSSQLRAMPASATAAAAGTRLRFHMVIVAHICCLLAAALDPTSTGGGSHNNNDTAAATSSSTTAASGRSTLHVSVAAAQAASLGHQPADGTPARPYHTVQAAKEHIIQRYTQYGDSGVGRVLLHPGTYAPFAVDHEAFSGIEWRGAGQHMTTVSGGIEIPRQRFKPWPNVSGAYVANLAGLGVQSLGAMVSGNEVSDCQQDKVGLSYNGNRMTIARWPNEVLPRDETAPYKWARAMQGCRATRFGSTFATNINEKPDVLRMLKWRDEPDAFLHGYYEWDWCPAFALPFYFTCAGSYRFQLWVCSDLGTCCCLHTFAGQMPTRLCPTSK